MINRTVSVLFWNVHGLGQIDKCAEIKRVLTSRLPSIVCLQESKLEEIPHFKKLSLLATSNIPRPSVFRLNNNWLTAPSFQSLVAANW